MCIYIHYVYVQCCLEVLTYCENVFDKCIVNGIHRMYDCAEIRGINASTCNILGMVH